MFGESLEGLSLTSIITNQFGLAEVGIDLLLECFDVDFVILDVRSVRELECLLWGLDRSDWHRIFIEPLVLRLVPILCGSQLSGHRRERKGD